MARRSLIELFARSTEALVRSILNRDGLDSLVWVAVNLATPNLLVPPNRNPSWRDVIQ